MRCIQGPVAVLWNAGGATCMGGARDGQASDQRVMCLCWLSHPTQEENRKGRVLLQKVTTPSPFTLVTGTRKPIWGGMASGRYEERRDACIR